MKPDFIKALEQQLGMALTPLPADRLDENRYRRSAGHYVLQEEKLVSLNLAGLNGLETLSIPATVCASLVYLNVHKSSLREIRFEGPLDQLVWLDLSYSKIERLNLSHCPRLEQLWLQHGCLSRFAFETACPSLAFLDVSHNPLESLIFPAGFESLAQVYAVHCQLSKVEFKATLRNSERFTTPVPRLNTLHLAENRLRQLPVNVVFGESLEALYLGGNAPVNFPYDMVGEHSEYGSGNCLGDARTFFEEFRRFPDEVRENRSVRLMLTGNGNVGKSTLVHALKHDECYEDKDSTHGVILEELKEFDESSDLKYQFQIWDFGGQEIYHRTHRLFLQSPAVQLWFLTSYRTISSRQ